MYSGWESKFLEAMKPKFEETEGSGHAEGEAYEDIDLTYFAERSGNDLVENGNTVRCSSTFGIPISSTSRISLASVVQAFGSSSVQC